MMTTLARRAENQSRQLPQIRENPRDPAGNPSQPSARLEGNRLAHERPENSRANSFT